MFLEINKLTKEMNKKGLVGINYEDILNISNKYDLNWRREDILCCNSYDTFMDLPIPMEKRLSVSMELIKLYKEKKV